jgi:hypothetical protein
MRRDPRRATTGISGAGLHGTTHRVSGLTGKGGVAGGPSTKPSIHRTNIIVIIKSSYVIIVIFFLSHLLQSSFKVVVDSLSGRTFIAEILFFISLQSLAQLTQMTRLHTILYLNMFCTFTRSFQWKIYCDSLFPSITRRGLERYAGNWCPGAC